MLLIHFIRKYSLSALRQAQDDSMRAQDDSKSAQDDSMKMQDDSMM